MGRELSVQVTKVLERGGPDDGTTMWEHAPSLAWTLRHAMVYILCHIMVPIIYKNNNHERIPGPQRQPA